MRIVLKEELLVSLGTTFINKWIAPAIEYVATLP